MPQKGYLRHSLWPLETILPLIYERGPGFATGHVRVNTSSNRLQVFKANLSCVKCGLTGLYFAIEASINHGAKNGHQGWHLNLYALRGGKEVLMTKDHIVPKSLGGGNGLDNLQTMCTDCNGAKGNSVD